MIYCLISYRHRIKGSALNWFTGYFLYHYLHHYLLQAIYHTKMVYHQSYVLWWSTWINYWTPFIFDVYNDLFEMYLIIGNSIELSAVIMRSNIIWYCALQELRENMNQKLNPQKTPHTSPWQASYGVSIMNILEKIGHVILALHCISME